MIISFAWTTPQFLDGTKTVTRRDWSDRTLAQWQKAWDDRRLVHDAYDKSPRSKGQKVGTFILTARPYRERLGDFPESDLVAEGGLWETVQDYIDLQGGDSEKELVVIRFCKIDATKIHPHVATHYELARACSKNLGAVLLRMERQPESYPDGEEPVLPYKIGDRLYLADKWMHDIDSLEESSDIVLKHEHPEWTEEWNSAKSMPHEATTLHFVVVEVDVIQGKWLTSSNLIAAGLLDKDNELIRKRIEDDALIEELGKQVMDLYNSAHPGQPFNRQAWYVLISLEIVKQSPKMPTDLR